MHIETVLGLNIPWWTFHEPRLRNLGALLHTAGPPIMTTPLEAFGFVGLPIALRGKPRHDDARDIILETCILERWQ
jgi:hypothetical protein